MKGLHQLRPLRLLNLKRPGCASSRLESMPKSDQNLHLVSTDCDCEEQIIKMQDHYKEIDWYIPLLPPLNWMQVYAFEAEHKIRFPPLLRAYFLSISRELALTYYRASILDIKRFRGICYLPMSDGCHFSSDIILSGPMAGAVIDNVMEEWQTLFECHLDVLQDSVPHATILRASQIRTPTLAHMLRGRLSPELIRQADLLPEHMQGRLRVYIESEDLSARLIAKLDSSARKIQAQFRLWRFRKNVVWNPYTDIGRLNMMIHFNVLSG